MKHSVVVIGARGYTGGELLPLLYRHPEFEIRAVGSGSAAGQPVSAHVSGMEGSDLFFSEIRPRDLAEYRADACVLALPNGFAAGYVAALDVSSPDTVVVDLSADHRFDPAWAYGQPERFAEEVREILPDTPIDLIHAVSDEQQWEVIAVRIPGLVEPTSGTYRD